MEKLVGKSVVLSINRAEKIEWYEGILKDYTSEFVLVMDVEYCLQGALLVKKADIIVPRSLSVVRYSSVS